MGRSYEEKSIKDLTKKVSGDISTKSNWSVEIGDETDANGQTYGMTLDNLETLIGDSSSPLTTKGDLYTFDSDNQRLAIGTDDYVLTADSSEATGMKWAAASGGGGTSIEDDDGTTGLYTEETADRLVGHSTGTGTDIIFEMFEGTGTPVAVFQIDGNGDLFRNSNYLLVNTSDHSTFISTESSHSGLSAGATYNIAIGYLAGDNITTGDYNVLIGQRCGEDLTTGSNHVIIGRRAGQNVPASGTSTTHIGTEAGLSNTGNYVTTLGRQAGYTGDGSNTLFLGYTAGYYNTVSNQVILDTIQRADEATELTDSLIVGLTDATKANQTIQFNAATTISGTKTGNILIVANALADVFTVSNLGVTYSKLSLTSDSYHKSTGVKRSVETIADGTTLDSDDFTCILNANLAARTCTLPDITSVGVGTIYVFKCIDSSNTVTVQTVTASQYIGYTGTTTSFTMVAGDTKTYQAFGTRWVQIFT